jgi:hypothetical protein
MILTSFITASVCITIIAVGLVMFPDQLGLKSSDKISAKDWRTSTVDSDELSFKEAAKKYQELVNPSNKLLVKLTKKEKVLANEPYYAKVPSSYKILMIKYRDSLRIFAVNLLKVKWPKEVVGTVNEVVNEISHAVTLADSLSKTISVGDIAQVYDTNVSDNSAAQKLRIQLGLGVAGS